MLVIELFWCRKHANRVISTIFSGKFRSCRSGAELHSIHHIDLNAVINSFTAHVTCQVHRLPSTAGSLTPITAQCRAHGIRRAHRMSSKPLAALYYARHSPGLTLLAACSAAHALSRLPVCFAPGARPHERARVPARTSARQHLLPAQRCFVCHGH